MKRVISCILAILLLLSTTNSMIATAADYPTLAVDTVTAERGEDVSLDIKLQNNPGIASIKLKVYFDSDLTLKAVTYNSGLGGNSQQPQKMDSPVTLNWYNGSANTTGDMTYATLVFSVSNTAVHGKHTVSISYSEDDVYNIDETNVAFTIVNGGVDIAETTVNASGISLNKNELSLNVGESESLVATIAPNNATNKTVFWTTSDANVVNVTASGEVGAIKAGEATITATSEDGEFTATCIVTVTCLHKNISYVADTNATCTEAGYVAHYQCEGCDKIFWDENGQDEITDISAIISSKPTGHSFGEWEETTPATCEIDGERIRYCQNDHSHYETETIPATGHNWKQSAIIKEATCTEQGTAEYICSNDESHKKTVTIPVKSHDLVLHPGAQATSKTQGVKAYYECNACHNWYEDATGLVLIKDHNTINTASPKIVSLSKTKYTYNGKARKPSVVVNDSNGNVVAPSNYVVSYKNNKKIGKAVAVVTFNNELYSTELSKAFQIVPKKTSITKTNSKAKSFVVKWKKGAKGITGYQVQYSLNKSFKKAKKVTVKGRKKLSKTVGKLKGNKTYYVRVRTYKKVGEKAYYSYWSKAKTIKTKK